MLPSPVWGKGRGWGLNTRVIAATAIAIITRLNIVIRVATMHGNSKKTLIKHLAAIRVYLESIGIYVLTAMIGIRNNIITAKEKL